MAQRLKCAFNMKFERVSFHLQFCLYHRLPSRLKGEQGGGLGDHLRSPEMHCLLEAGLAQRQKSGGNSGFWSHDTEGVRPLRL